jgi:hypothetical protein
MTWWNRQFTSAHCRRDIPAENLLHSSACRPPRAGAEPDCDAMQHISPLDMQKLLNNEEFHAVSANLMTFLVHF